MLKEAFVLKYFRDVSASYSKSKDLKGYLEGT